jgi:hypothetical protein
MKGNFVELEDDDFEFAKAPVSKEFIREIFEEYSLSFISHFGLDFFYVEMMDGEPLLLVSMDGSYPHKIEMIFDFMVTECVGIIKYENGVLMKGSIMGEPNNSKNDIV